MEQRGSSRQGVTSTSRVDGVCYDRWRSAFGAAVEPSEVENVRANAVAVAIFLNTYFAGAGIEFH